MKKYHPVLTKCPACSEDLHVTELSCDGCGTVIKGHFSFSKFNYIAQEKLYFIEVFVKNRGNIKAIEKELNVSYPTVKKMLDEVISELGYKVEEDEEVEEIKKPAVDISKYAKSIKKDILASLEKGEVTVEKALEQIKKIKGDL